MTAFVNRFRVRYGESDQMGVAHHAAYVIWLEEARIELMRERGVSYRELETQGILMPVIDIGIRYRRSLRFDDLAECVTTVTQAGPSRLVFHTVVRLGEQVCAEADVTVAAVDRSGRPIRLPAAIGAQLGA